MTLDLELGAFLVSFGLAIAAHVVVYRRAVEACRAERDGGGRQ